MVFVCMALLLECMSRSIYGYLCQLTCDLTVKRLKGANNSQGLQYFIFILLRQKFLKQQDQNLMKQFVKLRSVLNSIKSRATFDRKISLPETSPCSLFSPLYTISEDSPIADEGSPGLRRRAQTEPQDFPISLLCFDDDSDFSSDKYEHFAI